MSVFGYFDNLRGRAVNGWAWCPEQPERRVLVTVLIDGSPTVSGLAQVYRPDLDAFGDGHRAFSLTLPRHVMDGKEHELSILDDEGTALHNCPNRVLLDDLQFRPIAPRNEVLPFELAVCCIVKNEAPYLLEWVAFHRVIGVDHFLVFDNQSDDQTAQILDALARHGLLERVTWPTDWRETSPQLSAYTEGLRRLQGRAKWIAFIDLDEFLQPLQHRTVKELLGDFDDVGGLIAPWRVFGSSGETKHRDDLVIRRFQRRAADDSKVNGAVKTIVRSHCVASTEVHTPRLSEGCLVDEHRNVVGCQGDTDNHQVVDANLLVVNHYFCKSRAEWRVKQSKGRADVQRQRSDDEFSFHDHNDVEDRRILRFEAEVRDEMDRLGSLMEQNGFNGFERNGTE